MQPPITRAVVGATCLVPNSHTHPTAPPPSIPSPPNFGAVTCCSFTDIGNLTGREIWQPVQLGDLLAPPVQDIFGFYR